MPVIVLFVVSRASAFLATMKTIQKIGARYLQHFRNPLQRVSSGGSNGMREINFFDWATSRASRSISASIVLRPNIRSSSRTFLFRAFNSDALTTSSPDSIADMPPSFMPGYKRHRHAWPLTLRDHACFLLRGIPATALHSGYDFDSFHLGHSFALGLCLGLCFYKGVRFKWGLLHRSPIGAKEGEFQTEDGVITFTKR